MRYFIHMAYDGTSYCGWQVQNNGKTVQGELNFALSRLLSQPISTGGCGRTDAGVHATDFYAHFDTDKTLDERFTFRLNSILPKDIQIFRVIPVHEKSNTRFDAIQRTYEYYLHFDKNPFLRHQSTQTYGNTLDWEKIYEATALIPAFGDYTSLCRPSEDFKTNICDVTEARWDRIVRPAVAGEREYEFMRLTITSNRFLRGMIRKIVGVLLIIGRGKLSIADYKRIVEAKEEFPFGVSSPPQGLYLTKVVYKDGVLEGRAIDRSRKMDEAPAGTEEDE
ncbi:MAG: tRNA pseudouridine synthase A [Bacteroidetes bacterium]|nr:tRNA pseudouridine synthase A [Bacteroidota bacterium]